MKKMKVNRIKAILAEKSKTNKWLAEKLDKNETTISRWCTNETQPPITTLVQVAILLDVEVADLLSKIRE